MATTAATATTTILKRWFGRLRQQQQQQSPAASVCSECVSSSSRSSTCSGSAAGSASDLLLLEKSARRHSHSQNRCSSQNHHCKDGLVLSSSSSSGSSSSLHIQDDQNERPTPKTTTTTMRLWRPDEESLDPDCDGGGGHVNGGLLLEEDDLNLNRLLITAADCLPATAVTAEEKEKGEEDEKPSSREFSFTFYDLDGSPAAAVDGKAAPRPVSKDDIASLVRTIYGAVNSSITVPRRGKRTIRVRVSVSEEEEAAPIPSVEEDLKERKKTNRVHFPAAGDELHRGSPAGGGKARLRRRRKESNLETANQPQPPTTHEDCEQCDRAAAERLSYHNHENKHQARRSWRRSSHSHHRQPTEFTTTHNYNELCDLLLANMAKNNVSCCGGPAPPVHQPRCHSANSTPLRSGYPHDSRLNPNSTCPVNNPVTAGQKCNVNVNSAPTPEKSMKKSLRQRRSRSHDDDAGSGGGGCLEDEQILNNQLRQCNRCSTTATPAATAHCREFKAAPPQLPPKLNNLNNQHNLKHLHRAAEQRRAMAQVVSWLEQGPPAYVPVPGGLGPRLHKHEHVHHHHHYHHHHQCQQPPKTKVVQ